MDFICVNFYTSKIDKMELCYIPFDGYYDVFYERLTHNANIYNAKINDGLYGMVNCLQQ